MPPTPLPTETPGTEVLPPLPDGAQMQRQSASWSSKALAAGGVLISVLYLANIGTGIFELLPDLMPGVGNLDEVFFTAVLIYSLRQLGIDLMPFLKKSK